MDNVDVIKLKKFDDDKKRKHEIWLPEGEELFHVESQTKSIQKFTPEVTVYVLFLLFSLSAIYWWIPAYNNTNPPTFLWAALITTFASINLLYVVGRKPIRLILTSAGIRIPRIWFTSRLIRYEMVSAHFYLPDRASAQKGGTGAWKGNFFMLARVNQTSDKADKNPLKYFHIGPIDDLRSFRNKLEAIMGAHLHDQIPKDTTREFSVNDGNLKKIQRRRQILIVMTIIGIFFIVGLSIFSIMILTNYLNLGFILEEIQGRAIAPIFKELIDLLVACIVAIPVFLILLPGIVRGLITQAFLSKYNSFKGSRITIGSRDITIKGHKSNLTITLTRDIIFESIQSTRMRLSTKPAYFDAIMLRDGRTGLSVLVGPVDDFQSFYECFLSVYRFVLDQEVKQIANIPANDMAERARNSKIKSAITRVVIADSKRFLQRHVKRGVYARIVLFLIIQAFVIVPSSLLLHYNPPHLEPADAPTSSIDTTVTIWSFNIRRDDEFGVNSWSNRKDDFYEYVRFYDPDIIGFQEVFINQLLEMKNNLGEYRSIGIPRLGILIDEFVPIFYKYQRFKVIDQGNFWLSDTPHWPSETREMGVSRIVTWGRFLDVTTQDQFVVFNTHWDSSCQESIGCDRHLKSARVMLSMLPIFAGGLPAMMIGDYNSKVWNSGLQLFQNNSIMNFTGLWDASNPEQPDNLYTTNDWDPNHKTHASLDSQRIDHIFFNNKAWPTDATPTNCIIYQDLWNGRMMSDHWAIGGNVTF